MSDSGSEFAAPFELLGHEDRVRILEALVQRRVEDPTDPAVGFSDLRRRTGIEDSGRFNYHLGKLTGRFVSETDDGYELSAAGRKVVGALLSGSFEAGDERVSEELSAPCNACNGTVSAYYEDGMIRAECEEGHLNHQDFFPSSIVERTSLPEAMELASLTGQQDMELLLREVCPNCHGSAEVEIAFEEGSPVLVAGCDRCGHYLEGPPGLAVLPHPVLRGFYYERGRDVRTGPLWTLPFLVDPDRTHLEGEDPVRVAVDASVDGDELTFLLDGDCSVVEYDAAGR